MTVPRRFLTMIALIGALALLAATSGATSARAASRSCGIVTASGLAWIVVAKNVTCTTAKSVTRRLAARTAAVRSGQTVIVASPLSGFHCVLARQGRPGGSCATAGARKSILWLSA
jgi:cytochrome bd-type quinol oxidase subunit 2